MSRPDSKRTPEAKNAAIAKREARNTRWAAKADTDRAMRSLVLAGGAK